MSLATKLKAENGRLSHTEMTWFSRSAYNLVIERYKTWPHTALLSLTKSCIGFTSMTDKAHTDELLVYRCLCLYLRSVLSISIGREIEDTKTHHYAEAHAAIHDFNQIYLPRKAVQSPTAQNTLDDKYQMLLIFDFEALLHLREWQAMETIMKASTISAYTNLLGDSSAASWERSVRGVC